MERSIDIRSIVDRIIGRNIRGDQKRGRKKKIRGWYRRQRH